MRNSRRTRRRLAEHLIDVTIGAGRAGRSLYNVRAQRPDLEAIEVMEDYERRSPLQRWLLDWSPDSDSYFSAQPTIEREATQWVVRFRDQRDGKERVVRVPRTGTPPPPGWEDS
jgi:hypothetical protein